MGLKNFINHKKAEYLADPAEFINKRLDKVGNVWREHVIGSCT